MSMNAPEFTRLNDPNTHRNKYINFLSVLEEFDDHDEAMTKLCQLAAQVKPLMKHFGLRVNSLEEHEFNKEYAGINWNAGENVGLVLRGPSGRFHPLDYVLQVFHHELAHCQFMNHVPSQHGRLTAQLSKECKKLQQRGYFGDGFWSSGTNLKNEISKGDGLGSVISSRPKELCGGALSRKSKGRTPKKFTGYRKPRKGQLPGGGRSFKGPSLSSGAQTAANSKSAGNRMKKQLPGRGQRLDGNDHLQGASRANKLYTIDSNSTFGKSVRGQSHREKIAEAAERRMREERRRLERERRDEEENEYEELINDRNQRERQRGRGGGGFGNAIQIDSEDEEDDELDSEEEAERNQRIEEGVQVDSDLESEVDELISESEDEDDLPDAFQTIQGMKAKDARAKAKAKAKAKGKGKGKQTPRKSSTPSKKTQSQSRQTTTSSSSKTPKQLSEISRKAEGRNVGDTWNDVSLGSDDDGSFHYHSEDEEDFGDRFNTLRRDRDSEEEEDSDDDIFNASRDNGRKKNRKSTSSTSNGQGSSSRPSSSSSPIKRKASTSSIKKKVSFSKPEAQPEAKKPRNSSTLILPGRPDFQSKHASTSTSQTGKSQASNPKPQAKKSQSGKAEIIDLISDEEDQDEDSGVNIAQFKPHFTSSAQEKRWNELQALKADRERREREEEMQKKRNASSSSLASSSNTISDSENQPRSNPKPRASGASGSAEKRTMDLKWTCVICTLNNEWDASVCAGCDTTKGATMMGL